MVDRLAETRCPFLGGNEKRVGCSTPKGLPAAQSYVTAELQEPVKLKDVRGLFCDLGGEGCPVKQNLDQYGSSSMYAVLT